MLCQLRCPSNSCPLSLPFLGAVLRLSPLPPKSSGIPRSESFILFGTSSVFKFLTTVLRTKSGGIVNIPQWQASYNASKAAVIHLTRSLAAEWAGHGIRVNSISPGYIATPMSVDTPQELRDAWMPLIPMHRMGKPEELIPPMLYLATNASGYTSGSDVIVDGAYTCL